MENKSKLQIVRTSDKQIFDVKKYIFAEKSEHHVWCDDWYGRHVIGQDCEWYHEQIKNKSTPIVQPNKVHWDELKIN